MCFSLLVEHIAEFFSTLTLLFSLFMHGGFTNRVADFNWNKNDPWVMVAAAEDNQLQIFRPARAIVNVSKKSTVLNREVEE